MRSRLRLVPVLLALVLALAAPTTALAQQAPSLGAPSEEETTPTVTVDDGNDGLEGWQQALIVGAGLILLVGIGLAIIGDAREHVGAITRRGSRGRSPEDDRERAAAKHAHRQRAKERARAKGKHVRAQRRRNR